MGFLLFIGMCVVIWLLWNICRNTNDALDKQTAIQYEIVSLEKRMEELLDKLAEQNSDTKAKAQPGKKPEAPVEPTSGAELVKSPELMKSAEQVKSTDLININTATIKALTGLPKIGNALAQRIMDGRPYQGSQDLLNVKGVSKDVLSEFENKVTF